MTDSLGGVYGLAGLGYVINNQPVLLYATTLAATQATVVYSVTSPYPRIKCIWRARASDAIAAEMIQLRINGASTSSYQWQTNQANNTTVAATDSGGATTSIQVGTVCAASATAGYFSSGEFTVDGADQSATFPTVQGTGTAYVSTSNSYVGVYSGQYNVAALVTSLTLLCQTGSFVAGSQFSFYGLS